MSGIERKAEKILPFTGYFRNKIQPDKAQHEFELGKRVTVSELLKVNPTESKNTLILEQLAALYSHRLIKHHLNDPPDTAEKIAKEFLESSREKQLLIAVDANNTV